MPEEAEEGQPELRQVLGPGLSERLLIAALGAAAALTLALRGGYTEAGRGAAVVFAGLALAAAMRVAPTRASAAARAAPVVTLLALAALGALSALWTLGAVDDALRWALVIAALAAIVVAAAGLTTPVAGAAILLAVATAAAAIGVVGAARHADPLGLDVCGAWRPAGPLEYPPALALVCTMALPAAVACAALARRAPAALGGAAGWLLVATVGVSGSRTSVALAALSLLAAAALLRGAAAPRAALLIAVTGAASAVIAGGELGDDTTVRALAALLPAVVAAAGAPTIARAPGRGAARRAPVNVLVLLAVLGLAATAAATAQERASDCAYAGFGHGRGAIWRAAWHTVEQQPLRGAGLEAFAVASRAEQRRVRDTPVQYAHDLPLETWAELGLAGLAIVLALYVVVTRAALRAGRDAAALLAPPALAFLAANLLDWPWHLAGCGVLWAIAVGGLVGARPAAAAIACAA